MQPDWQRNQVIRWVGTVWASAEAGDACVLCASGVLMHRFYKRLMRADARISGFFSEVSGDTVCAAASVACYGDFESPDAPVRVPGGWRN